MLIYQTAGVHGQRQVKNPCVKSMVWKVWRSVYSSALLGREG